MTDQTARLTWTDTAHGAVPVSARFEDPYYALAGGLAETRHVFLDGNDLPGRFRAGFHVAELGFGTGLNLLATLAAYRASGTPGRLRFTSFELYPMTRADRMRALAPFDGIDVPLLDRDDLTAIELPDLDFRLVPGDARKTVPAWEETADAWFLDGFSPARNPELWEPALMRAVAARTAPEGTFATYSAAGGVRRALADAGFAVARVPGFGTKRHMTRGSL